METKIFWECFREKEKRTCPGNNRMIKYLQAVHDMPFFLWYDKNKLEGRETTDKRDALEVTVVKYKVLEPNKQPVSRAGIRMELETLGRMQIRSQEYRRLMAYYNCALMEVETKFQVLNEEFSMLHDYNPIVSIQSRLKEAESIKEKLERYGCPSTLEAVEKDLNDVAGVRVICSFPQDVYMIADALLSQDDVNLLQKKDYIAKPKPNGYRSLHLIVEVPIFLSNTKKMIKVEIQLRTIAMDCWATLEHQLNYKKGLAPCQDMARELKECAELSAQLDFRMEAVRKNYTNV